MKEKLKKHKKLLIIVAVVSVIAILFAACSAQMKKNQQMMMEAMNQQETALLEKRSLVSSVSATGTVTSVDSKDLSVSLTGVDVEEVMVEVGDTVAVGDILCIFDSEDIEDSLADAKVSLNASTSKSQIDVASSERSLAEAVVSRDIDAARNSDDVADALNDYEEALDDVDDAEDAYEDAEDAASDYKSQLEKLNKKKSGLESDLSTYSADFYNARDAIVKFIKENGASVKDGFESLAIGDEVPGSAGDVYKISVDTVDSSDDANEETDTNADISAMSIDDSVIENYLNAMKEAQISYNTNNTELTKIITQITSVQTKYEAAKQTEKSLKSAYDSAVTAADGKYDSYEQKVRNQEDAARNNESTIANKTDSVNTSKLNASTTGMSDKNQIEQYEEQLENCTVTAPIAGVITAVNVEAGDTYSGTTLLTIEDNSSYEVSAEIDEYDIGKIAVGQKVVIKTNGTGDEELEGTVQKIAPRATTGSADVTYNVRISIDTPNDMLRMDMTAKLSIILESRENVLTVPYEAVMEDENGDYYIEVVKQDQTDAPAEPAGKGKDANSSLQTEKIYVGKGIESDYYIEVTGADLLEGMEVVVPKTESDGMNIQELMQQGPMGGF